MNSENSKTSDSHRRLLDLVDKMDLKMNEKYFALSNISMYHYRWKKLKNFYKNNKFKISGLMWNEKFELADGSYSVSDIQDYFECIIKKHETLTVNSPIQIYVNKIEKKMI